MLHRDGLTAPLSFCHGSTCLYTYFRVIYFMVFFMLLSTECKKILLISQRSCNFTAIIVFKSQFIANFRDYHVVLLDFLSCPVSLFCPCKFLYRQFTNAQTHTHTHACTFAYMTISSFILSIYAPIYSY